MSESTVFAPSDKKPEEKPQVAPQSPVPTAVSQPVVEQPLIEEYGGDEDENEGFMSSFPFGKILKIIIGIIILGLVGFLFFIVVLPLLFQNKNEKVTLTYWGHWETKATMQPIFDEFHRLNPNITIDYVQQDKEKYLDRLKARFKEGNGPDIYRFHSSWLPELGELLLPLSQEVITPTNFQKNYYPVTQSDLIENGAIYGIPLEIDTLSMFVNTEIFQAGSASVPTDWNEFAQVARNLTARPVDGGIKTAGAAMGTYDNINHAPDIVSLLFLQNGANLKDLSSTNKNAAEALDFYTSFTKGNASTWDSSMDTSLVAFSKGNLAMYFGYSWDVFVIKAMNPTLQFTIHSMPRVRGGKNMTVSSYWAEGVYAKTKHPKEALLFMQYLAKKETQQKLFSEEAKTRLFGEPYSLINLADSLKDNPLVYQFVSQGPSAVSTFFASETHDNGLNAQANAYLGNAVRAVLNNTSAASAVDTLSQGVAKIFKDLK